MIDAFKSNIRCEQFVKSSHLFKRRIFIKEFNTDSREMFLRNLKSRILRSNSTFFIIWICRKNNSSNFTFSTCSILSRSIYACIVKSSRFINMNIWKKYKIYYLSFSTFAFKMFFHAELLSSFIFTSSEFNSNSCSYAKTDACWCLVILRKEINIKITTQKLLHNDDMFYRFMIIFFLFF
jgi:hypothetical protein